MSEGLHGTRLTREELERDGIIAPRSPTVADRRKIMDALELAYDIKASCYVQGGSDNKLALELAVPRAWVRDVRAQFFGDLNVSQDELLIRDELAAALAECRSLKGRLGQWEGKVEELLRRAEKVLGVSEQARRRAT